MEDWNVQSILNLPNDYDDGADNISIASSFLSVSPGEQTSVSPVTSGDPAGNRPPNSVKLKDSKVSKTPILMLPTDLTGSKELNPEDKPNEHSVLFCKPCFKVGTQTVGVRFCLDCKENLCANCVKYYLNNIHTKHHRIHSKPQKVYIEGNNKKYNHCNIETCTKHVNDMLEYFCSQHASFGCSTCMLLDHRECNFESISEAANRTCSEFQSTLPEIINTIDRLESLVEMTADVRDNNTKSFSAAMNEIDAFMKKLDGKIKDRKEELFKEATRVKNTKEDVVEQLKFQIKELRDIYSSLQERKSKYFDTETFVLMKKAQSLLKSLKLYANAEVKLQVPQIIFKFKPNERLCSILSDPDGLGKVSKVIQLAPKETIASSNSVANISTVQTLASVIQKPSLSQLEDKKTFSSLSVLRKVPTLSQRASYDLIHNLRQPEGKITYIYQDDLRMVSSVRQTTSQKPKPNFGLLAHKYDISIKSESDELVSYITGCVILSDGRVALADIHNRQIKVVDVDKKEITQVMTMDDRPYDLAVMPLEKIAVTVPDKKKILILNISSKISQAKHIDVECACYGITCFRQNLFVVCYDPNTLLKLDMHGRLISKISLFETSWEEKINFPSHIAVDNNQQLIYISDKDGNCLVSVDIQDTPMLHNIRRVKEYNCLRGLVVTEDGSLLICCDKKGVILHVSVDQKQGDVLKMKVPNAMSICYKSQSKEIIMGFGNCDIIKVFSFR